MAFPQANWEIPATPEWNQMCMALASYSPTPVSLTQVNPDRKWEIVSAYQKAVRRGDEAIAQKMVCAMALLPKEEYKYAWKRICTTACEDIGPSNVEVMNFVIACSMVWTPSKVEHLLKVWRYVTHLMCSLDGSRIYCQMSIIDTGLKEEYVGSVHVTHAERELFHALKAYEPTTARGVWAKKNDWRGEGMLGFQDFQFPSWCEFHRVDPRDLSATPLFGLPEYAYDMHTRVGKMAIIKSFGTKQIKDAFSGVLIAPGEPRDKLVGWCLFFCEGGLIRRGSYCPTLSALERYYVCQKFGITPEQLSRVMGAVVSLLEDGTLTSLRESVLKKTYA